MLSGTSCQACDGNAEHWHHIVPRSQGGEDAVDNLIPLCHQCHEDWHKRDVLHSNILTGAQLSYVILRKGSTWLHRNYPSRTTPF